MHRNRSRGARNNRHRRSFEEMLDVVTSTPAGEGAPFADTRYHIWSAAISACETNMQLESALGVLQEMARRLWTPNVVS